MCRASEPTKNCVTNRQRPSVPHSALSWGLTERGELIDGGHALAKQVLWRVGESSKF